MIRPGLLAVLALAVAPASGLAQGGQRSRMPESWTVKAEMGDAKTVTGTLNLTSVMIDCDLGHYEVKPGKVREIRFDVGGPRPVENIPGHFQRRPGTLIATSGEEIRGAITTSGWTIETELGDLTLELKNLKVLSFLAKAE